MQSSLTIDHSFMRSPRFKERGRMEEKKEKSTDLLTEEQRWMGTLAAACLGAMAVRKGIYMHGNECICIDSHMCVCV